MILEETFRLANGIEIPKLGLGTWFISNKNVVQAVQDAARIGYRHIDTAQVYHNEVGVAKGIKSCGVSREQMFIANKLGAGIKSYTKAVKSIDKSLQKMGLDYLDMMIIHSPQPWTKFGESERFFEGNLEAWRALEDAHKAGKLRAIGVSNFQQQDLENIVNNAGVAPMVNQVLAHIGNTPFDLIDFCQNNEILVEAYSPVAHGQLLRNDAVISMAQKYGVTVAQLAIRYDLQLGLLPLPKTANPAHMTNNAAVEFIIEDADMSVLKNVEKITDYGRDGYMPVFGGKLTIGAILGALFGRNNKAA